MSKSKRRSVGSVDRTHSVAVPLAPLGMELERPTCDDPWMVFVTSRSILKRNVYAARVHLPRFRLQHPVIVWDPSWYDFGNLMPGWMCTFAQVAVDDVIDRNGDLILQPFQTET